MINTLFENNNAALKASIVNLGSLYRIKKVILKAKRGEPITLGFLGGSITAGSGAGDGKNYVRCVYDFWSDTFPKSEATCVNAGIGATGSILGVFRMEKDVLLKKPDLLFIDHSVNDNGDEARVPGSTRETYESVIRRGILSGAAVVPVCVCNRDGSSQRELNLQIAKHYNLPFISMVDGIYEPLIKTGKYPWSDYSGDSVHPNATGHRMLGELLIHYIKTAIEIESDSSSDGQIPPPLFGDSYMDTEMLDGCSLIPKDYGSFSVGNMNFSQFKGGWISDECGKPMIFHLNHCKKIHIAFVKSIYESAGSATVRIGEDEFLIDSSFAGGWGNYAETKLVFSSEKPKDVTLSITPNEKGKIFALLRIMIAH